MYYAGSSKLTEERAHISIDLGYPLMLGFNAELLFLI